MARVGTLYVERNSIFHQLDGSIKFLLLLLWTSAIFQFNDIRVFILFFLTGISFLKLSKVKFKEVKALFLFIVIFTIMNSIFLLLVTPNYGNQLTNTETYLLSKKIGSVNIVVTLETLWFCLTLSMKYLSLFPVMLLFILTTHPTRFASSLNRIGVPYRVAYAINIALRYIPDIRDEFRNIKNAQEARGIAFSKEDADLLTRFKNYKNILVPLVISSMTRIDTITNAMTLRGFGKEKDRTWFGREPFTKKDKIFFFCMIAIFLLIITLKIILKPGFYYPFN